MEKRLKNLEDGYRWAKETAQALKSGNLDAVDMDALVDEIESVYTGFDRQLSDYLEDVLKGKLRLQYPASSEAGDAKKNEALVAEGLIQLSILLSAAPSIRDALTEELIDDAYQWVRDSIERDTESRLPERCPYSRNDLLKSIETLEMDDVEG